MKKNNLLLCLFSLVFIFVATLPVYASGYSIEIICPLDNLEVSLYRVGDDRGFVAPFDKYPLSLDGDWQGTCNALVNYIKVDLIEPLKKQDTNVDNKVTFDGLEKGIYLVSIKQEEREGFVYFFQNSMFDLKGDLEAEIKYDKKTIDDLPSSIHVLKKWENDNVESRPTSVSVVLYKGADIIDKQVLNKDNNWSFTWDNLDNTFEYSVMEETVSSGYKVSVSSQGNTIMITNSGSVSEKEEKVDGKLPLTGQLWWPVPILFILGALCLFKGNKDEKK